MSGREQTGAADTIRDQAIAWLVRVQSDQASPEDWSELSDWLEASPDHLAAFEEIERMSAEIEAGAASMTPELARPSAEIVPFRSRRASSSPNRTHFGGKRARAFPGSHEPGKAQTFLGWRASSSPNRTHFGGKRARAFPGSHEPGKAQTFLGWRASSSPNRTHFGGKRASRFTLPALVAASAAGVAAVSLLAWPLLQGQAASYRTGIGQTRDLTLADGSHVRLDAASQISVRMSLSERRVAMGDGQASFDVAKDPGRPFLIRFGDEQVRVVGTEFNIRHYDGRSTITVRRGVVEVAQVGGAGAAFRLTRGDELRHRDGSGGFERGAVDPDGAFAWTEGRLVADDQPAAEVAAYLSRRYSVPVRMEGGAASARFSGVLVLADEASTVRTFAQLTSRRATRTADAFVLR